MMVSGLTVRRMFLLALVCASFATVVLLGFSLRAHANTFPTPCDIFNQLGQEGLPPGSCTPTPPTCDAGQHVDTDTNRCVPDVPVCDAGQHLDSDTNTCVPDSTGGSGDTGGSTDTGGTTATSTATSTDSGTGGDTPQGGGPSTTDQNSNVGSNGGGGGASTLMFDLGTSTASTTGLGGEVLGTSTEATTTSDDLPASCTPLLTTFLRMGAGNKSEVMKLQTFLNSHMSANLPVTGVFGPLTFEAVKKFQTQYWQDVLAPWVPHGLPSDHTPTGYVYKTTQRMINLLSCNNSITIPVPALP